VPAAHITPSDAQACALPKIGMRHEHLTDLGQEQLDWISRFADRLRLERPRFANEGASHDANDIARVVWEQGASRRLAPEAAAERWLEEQARI
jgi:hypothetical protein